MADEAGSVERIDHGQLYSTGLGVYTHGAESFFSAFAGPRSATTTTSRARSWSATPRKAHGAKITVGWRRLRLSGFRVFHLFDESPRLSGRIKRL